MKKRKRMMARPDLDVVRAYINIYTADKATLEEHYGWGWSEYVRNMIHEQCNKIRYARSVGMRPLIGDEDDNATE
jgi:hypothetical protein